MKFEELQFCEKVKELILKNKLNNRNLIITCNNQHPEAALQIAFKKYSELKVVLKYIYGANYDDINFTQEVEYSNCKDVYLNLLIYQTEIVES